MKNIEEILNKGTISAADWDKFVQISKDSTAAAPREYKPNPAAIKGYLEEIAELMDTCFATYISPLGFPAEINEILKGKLDIIYHIAEECTTAPGGVEYFEGGLFERLINNLNEQIAMLQQRRQYETREAFIEFAKQLPFIALETMNDLHRKLGTSFTKRLKKDVNNTVKIIERREAFMRNQPPPAKVPQRDDSDFRAYLTDVGIRILPELVKRYSGAKPKTLALMLHCLQDFGLLSAGIRKLKQDDLTAAVKEAFKIDKLTRQALFYGIDRYEEPDFSEQTEINEEKIILHELTKTIK